MNPYLAGVLLGLVMTIVIYWSLSRFPAIWWLVANVIIVMMSLLLTRLTPTLLLPFFFKLEPVEDAKLKERLTNPARQAGTPACGVFAMDLSSGGTTANSMLAGFGLMMTSLINAYRRYVEAISGKIALHLTGDPRAFIIAMTKLTDQNLIEAEPSCWEELMFYDHLSCVKRVRLAQNYLEQTTREALD